jgi:hypothetical protein
MLMAPPTIVRGRSLSTDDVITMCIFSSRVVSCINTQVLWKDATGGGFAPLGERPPRCCVSSERGVRGRTPRWSLRAGRRRAARARMTARKLTGLTRRDRTPRPGRCGVVVIAVARGATGARANRIRSRADGARPRSHSSPAGDIGSTMSGRWLSRQASAVAPSWVMRTSCPGTWINRANATAIGG